MEQNIRTDMYAHRPKQPARTFLEIKVDRLNEDILDIEQTLIGGIQTKHRTALELELKNKRAELQAALAKAANNAPLPGHPVWTTPNK